jgi:hypothetical protein
MSNEQTTPKTALDVLEDLANEHTRLIKESWEHSGKVCAASGTDMKKRFLTYHLAAINTFAMTVLNPSRAINFVLGAIARDLVNVMTEDEKAELATITAEELENAKKEL